MHRSRLQDREPFTTLDGSTIREVAHPAWTAARHQSLAEATVPPHGATEAHLHRVTEELYFFTAGRGRMRLGDDEFDVAAGDCVVIPPGTEHALVNAGRRAARAAVLLRARLQPTRTPSSRGPRRSRAPGAAPTPRRDAPVPHDARGPGRRAGDRARPRPPRPRGAPAGRVAAARARARRAAGRPQRAERHRLPRPDVPPPGPALRAPRRPVGPRAGPRPPAHRGPSLGRPRRVQRDRAAHRVRRDVVLAPQPQPLPVAVALPDRRRALPPAVPGRPRLHPVERGQPLPAADGRAARRWPGATTRCSSRSAARAASSAPTSSTSRAWTGGWPASAAACAAAPRACGGCTTTRTATTTCGPGGAGRCASRSSSAARSGPRRPAASCGS